MAKRKASKAKVSQPVKRAKASGRKRPPVDPATMFTDDGVFVDPIPRPPTQLANPLFLEQVTLGRWLDFVIPAEVEEAISSLADHISIRGSLRLFGDKPTASQVEQLRLALAISYKRGYYLAVLRYEEDLKHVPELASWHRSREKGGDKGRQTLTRRREERAREIRAKWAEMEANGEQPTNESVARAIGCGRSTVIRAFKSEPKR